MDNQEKIEGSNEILIVLTVDIVSAYVSNNVCRTGDIPALITDVHAALAQAESAKSAKILFEKPKPAINPRRSITDEYIICLEDGKKFKSLKRHLMTHYNMTPEQYREKWELDPSYPMVAPNYAQTRSVLAKGMGLGRKRERKLAVQFST
ncbi:MAG: ROS/MUCR transcriptional regulator protein [Candidatus Tokpelaia sp. JSC188]|nr:MAG: ROS/MUCR transcriptional regulator protein [Candidatus Tokpelaia sp. JSC188]